MNGVFYIGASGLDAQQRALEIVANNIANMNTPAFKRSRAQFSQVIATNAPVPADEDSPPANLSPTLMGVRLDTASPDLTQGDLTQTGSPLDVAIDGAGFIQLMGPGGESRLWRGGSLMVNADGYLSAANGMPLQALISVPRGASSLTIGADGRVTAALDGVTEPVNIGQIDLVQDVDPSTVTSLSGGLYAPQSEADLVSSTPGTDGTGVLAPGFIEASNVNLANEMVELLLMQRAYSANAQVVQAGDQLMSIANSLKG